MPAETERFGLMRPRERAAAFAFVAIVQAALGLVLLSGFRVDFVRARDAVQRLIQVRLPTPPPPPIVRVTVKPQVKPAAPQASSPKAAPAPPGGSPGPVPHHASPSVTPIVSVQPTAPPSGGGTGTGPAAGSGAGGGSGGEGYGGGGGGTDLELISGDIGFRDYPKHLGNAGIGGRVSMTFTVGVDGRARGCRVTHSSGVAELDALTCRLIEKRFRFRPSTDRYGRPVPDEVDWDHDWVAD
jgi:protein TonB